MKVFLRYVTATVVAVSLSFGLELIFALIVRSFYLTSAVIVPVNQVIKLIGILTAAIIAVRKRGLISGAAAGALYAFFANLLFGLIACNFGFDLSLVLDLLFGIICGALAGIIRANLLRR